MFSKAMITFGLFLAYWYTRRKVTRKREVQELIAAVDVYINNLPRIYGRI